MTEQEFNDLILRYQQGRATDDEKRQLEGWLRHNRQRADLSHLSQSEKENIRLSILTKIEAKRIHKESSFEEQMHSSPLKGRLVNPHGGWTRGVVRLAASVLLLATLSYFGYQYIYKDSRSSETIAIHDLVPGSDKAVLSLADGSQIELNGVRTQIPQQGAAQVRSQDGKLSYETSGVSTELIYNTVATPRGGQYQLTLSDGSKVWLNSVSSLRYPTSFNGNERVVELTGEAYFEIAHNESMPFKVLIPSGAEVQVLGTHFNMKAYEEENEIKTTLLEGSVKVSLTSSSPNGEDRGGVTLSPNQQAQITKDGKLSVIKDYNVSEAVAWKEGFFSFEHADLYTVMRELARWYDVEVVYEGNVSPMQFGGKISRSSNASDVLKILEYSNVHFRIEGRKIIVTQ